jgi:hypothetical protein
MRAKTLGTAALCTLVLAALPTCGSGGGDAGTSAATMTIMIGVSEDAHTDGAVLTIAGDRHLVGDDAGGNDYRGLLRFPLATVPAGANVVGAFLNLSFLDRFGTPAGPGINNLGDLQFIRISGAAPLAAGDYGAPPLAHDPANNLTVDFPNLRPRIGLLAPVLSALAASDTHLKLRLQYQTASNFNGVADYMEFASLAHATEPAAVLEVVIEVP